MSERPMVRMDLRRAREPLADRVRCSSVFPARLQAATARPTLVQAQADSDAGIPTRGNSIHREQPG